jgi:hypothetical protein
VHDTAATYAATNESCFCTVIFCLPQVCRVQYQQNREKKNKCCVKHVRLGPLAALFTCDETLQTFWRLRSFSKIGTDIRNTDKTPLHPACVVSSLRWFPSTHPPLSLSFHANASCLSGSLFVLCVLHLVDDTHTHKKKNRRIESRHTRTLAQHTNSRTPRSEYLLREV